MKGSVRLGKIERVPIRSVWANEEHDFTPWVKENISLIADLIEQDIEDVENEITVGSYSADLVGKIVGTGELIVIENQFGETNHDHLGKLLTYLSGKNAKIGVWIAEKFRSEHIATLDYLNENVKSDGPSLFGIKIVMKRIGNSDPAPELVVIVKPNEYQREISQPILSESDKRRHKICLEFFTKLVDKYKELNPNWHKVKAQPDSWLAFTAGRSGFSYVWAFKMKNGPRFSIELYIDQRDQEENRRMLNELEKMRGDIEKELGFKVDFEELQDRRACKIEYSKSTSGPITKLTEAELQELINWGAEKMSVFSRVMSKYVRKLES